MRPTTRDLPPRWHHIRTYHRAVPHTIVGPSRQALLPHLLTRPGGGYRAAEAIILIAAAAGGRPTHCSSTTTGNMTKPQEGAAADAPVVRCVPRLVIQYTLACSPTTLDPTPLAPAPLEPQGGRAATHYLPPTTAVTTTWLAEHGAAAFYCRPNDCSASRL